MTIALLRPGAPTDALPSLSVEDAAQKYEQAGVPRTIRRIQKYCARGDLACQKVETEFGEKYLITSESVDRHIAQIRDALAAAGRALTRPDAPERSLQEHASVSVEPGAPATAQARPDGARRDYQTVYLDHLEKENA